MFSKRYFIQQGFGTGSKVSLSQGVDFRDEQNRWCEIIKVGSKYVHWQYKRPEGQYDYIADEKKEVSGFLMNFVTEKFRLVQLQIGFVPLYEGMTFRMTFLDFVVSEDNNGRYRVLSEEQCVIVKLFGNTSQCPVVRTTGQTRCKLYENGQRTHMRVVEHSDSTWLNNRRCDEFGNINNCHLI